MANAIERRTMASKFIYFLLIVATASLIEAYFLNDDLDTNLPERFGDPIEENWQDKRSAEKEYSSLKTIDDFPNSVNNKESTNFDYRNGNAETEVDDGSYTLEKRESKADSNVDEPFNDEDIRQIFSEFSQTDREAFDNLMNDHSPTIDVDKRQLLKQNFENNFHLNKRNDFKKPCKGLRCEDEFDQRIPMSRELNEEEDAYNQCPEKLNTKRKLKFKRSNRFHSTPRENILQAKISILKDNYKRSSEMRLLEDSANRRYSKNKRKLDSDQRRSGQK